MKKRFLPTTLFVVLSLLSSTTSAQTQETDTQQVDAQNQQGQVYVVQEGDGLYKLARKFFGSLKGVSKIVKSHNEKAANDDRFEPIDYNTQLATGQILWIPIANIENQNSTNSKLPTATAVTEGEKQQSGTIASQNDDDVDDSPAQRPVQSSNDPSIANNDQAAMITVPQSNCEIRIWYNFQVVAISRLNERWKANGMSLIDRAKRAYTIRHNARVNGRYMMADRFEVATLRDRDNKKYGDPDGPSFEYLINYHRESGFEGDEIYHRIIESSARTSPVFATECK